jgi:hypothetical protein
MLANRSQDLFASSTPVHSSSSVPGLASTVLNASATVPGSGTAGSSAGTNSIWDAIFQVRETKDKRSRERFFFFFFFFFFCFCVLFRRTTLRRRRQETLQRVAKM